MLLKCVWMDTHTFSPIPFCVWCIFWTLSILIELDMY